MKASLVSFNCLNNRHNLIGGAEVHIYEVAKILAQHGFNVDIVQKWNRETLIHEDDRISVYGIKAYTEEDFRLKWPKKIDWRHTEIVHLNDPYLIAPVNCSKLTATFHGISWDLPLSLPSEIFGAKIKFLRSPYMQWKKFINLLAVKRLAKILSVDTGLLRIVESDFPQFRAKVKVIYNFVDTKKFMPKEVRKGYIRALPKKPHCKIILFPRNISYARGFVQAVEAMNILVTKHRLDVYLVFVGRPILGPELLYLQRLIRFFKLEDRIIFLGGISHDNMPSVYQSCDVAIIPSLYREGTSLSVFEAMACKVPVVATRVGGLNDQIIDGINGLLVEPGNSEVLASAILRILLDNTLRSDLIENAYDSVKHFSKDRWVKEILGFFEIKN